MAKAAKKATSRAASKGEGDTVALTVRVSREGWKRLSYLAVDENTSIQALAIEGFNRVLKHRGETEL
jgi:hypothetical protein